LAGAQSEIPIRFTGEGSGTGELTWGQLGIWETIRATGRTMNIGGVMPLPEGTPVEEIAGVLRFAVERHQALRTLLRFDPARPDAPLRQTVVASGTVSLLVMDLDDGDDAAAAAETLRARYEFTPFDYAREFPVRMGVIRQAGALTHLVVQYCHIAVDGLGIDAIVRDLAFRDPATGSAAAPVRGVRPLDLAAAQASAAGRRQSEKSLRYWEKLLADLPPRRFGPSRDPQEPRFWELLCYSPALHLALRSISARTGADGSHVLLGAYAVALARVTGRNPSVAQVIVSNRFRPGFADAVAQLSQTGLSVIDVADCVFDDVVARAWKAATAAYMHGYYDGAAHRRLLREVAERRGEPVDLSCFVNDRRGAVPPAPGEPLPTEQDLRAALPRTRLRWDRKLPTYDGSFYLHVDSAPDTNVPGRDVPDERELPAVYFAIWADTHQLAPAQIQACARELEAVAVEAAFDAKAPTRVR
jgi:hypothetical protein